MRPLCQPRASVRRRIRKKIGPGDAAIRNPTRKPSPSALAISASHALHCRVHGKEKAASSGAAFCVLLDYGRLVSGKVHRPRPWVAARIVAPPSATVSWSTTTLGRLAPSRDQLTPLFDEAYTRVFLSTRSSPSPCLWNRDARNDLLLIVLWVRAVVVGADRRRQVDIAGEVVAEVVADERVLAAE